jgi:hypothetical protein
MNSSSFCVPFLAKASWTVSIFSSSAALDSGCVSLVLDSDLCALGPDLCPYLFYLDLDLFPLCPCPLWRHER